MSAPNYWGHIPANVRYSTVSASAKLLYCELTALTNQKGYAWATNGYFAKLYNVHPNTITEWVRELKKAGFIRIEIDPKRGNERRVWTVAAQEGSTGKAVEVSVKSCRGSTGKAVEEYNKGIDVENKGRIGSQSEEVVEEKEKKGRAAYEEFKAYWNENVGDQSPQIRMYSEKRARELSARLKNPDWRENWKAAVEKIKECPFLTGENDRKWTADAEFFLRPDTVAKIIEGKYDAKEEDPYKKVPLLISTQTPKTPPNMPNLNKVLIIGNLTRDPETKHTPSGKAVTELGLAINHTYTTEGGEKREETTFVDVTLWGRVAEVAGQYLKKGKPVFVEGRLKLETWDDKTTGAKRSKLTVTGENIQLLGSKDGQKSDNDF